MKYIKTKTIHKTTKTLFLLSLFLPAFLLASECSSYYKPEKFYDAPSYLEEIIQENLEKRNLKLFSDINEYKKLNFTKKNKTYIKKDSFLKQKEYIYPIKRGLWKYKIKNNKIDEINLARVELYRYKEDEIANDLNDAFDQFWNDWIEDAYEMILLPQETLFVYKQKYFSFSVYIYGFQGDSTKLKGTVVNYVLKDFTKEVQKYKQCKKDKI